MSTRYLDKNYIHCSRILRRGSPGVSRSVQYNPTDLSLRAIFQSKKITLTKERTKKTKKKKTKHLETHRAKNEEKKSSVRTCLAPLRRHTRPSSVRNRHLISNEQNCDRSNNPAGAMSDYNGNRKDGSKQQRDRDKREHVIGKRKEQKREENKRKKKRKKRLVRLSMLRGIMLCQDDNPGREPLGQYTFPANYSLLFFRRRLSQPSLGPTVLTPRSGGDVAQGLIRCHHLQGCLQALPESNHVQACATCGSIVRYRVTLSWC